MTQTQTCQICGRSGFLVDNWIYIESGEKIEDPIFIGQCPNCRRFICSVCGEKLDLSQKKYKTIFSFKHKKASSLVVCCPFDPYVPLGRQKIID
jgi:hypothetical protein